MSTKRENIILKKTFDFSLLVMKYVEELEKKKNFVIATQLLKSATSIGANVREAQYAESKFDFIHKLKIAEKETIETQYWLELCQAAENYPNCEHLIMGVKEIHNILSRIIISSKNNNSNNS